MAVSSGGTWAERFLAAANVCGISSVACLDEDEGWAELPCVVDSSCIASLVVCSNNNCLERSSAVDRISRVSVVFCLDEDWLVVS